MPWRAVPLSAACGMHRCAVRPCEEPRRARSAAARHTGALRVARVDMNSRNRAWRPAALSTVKREPLRLGPGCALTRRTPPPRRAPRRPLGAPGHRVALSQQSMARYGETSLPPAELHYHRPHAATRRARTASRSHGVSQTCSAEPGSGVAASRLASVTGCAPAWRAPRAHAPAPRRSAAPLPPPPHRAPRCVRAAPRRTASVS